MQIVSWGIVAIVIGAVLALCIAFIILSIFKMRTLNSKSTPLPNRITLGPKTGDGLSKPGWTDIEKKRGMRGISDGAIPLALKTIVGFFDTLYIGDTYSCKIYLFNTAKDAEKAEDIVKGIMKGDESKKFETDTLYAKEQEPVKVKIEIVGPNFIITPASRVVEVAAGALVISTHLIAPLNTNSLVTIIGKSQGILIDFFQIFDNETQIHLGSIDFPIKVEKAVIPTEIESEIKTQDKIRYISTAAGAVAALITALSTVLAMLQAAGIL